MRPRTAVLTLVAAATTAAPAVAQSWESPTFFSPLPHDDIGLYLVKFEGADDLGFHGIWRQSGNINLGVRGGIGPGNVDWVLGAEFFGPLNLFGPDSPILASWIVSGGALFTEDRGRNLTVLRIPAGVSLGIQTGSSAVQIVPYAFPRVAFDLAVLEVDEDEEDTDTEFRLDLDLGADVMLGERFVLRAGFTFGRDATVGVGAAYRIPRRVVVR